MGLEKSTVSRLAAGMEGRGWLRRERHADNRRLYRLELTAQGSDVAERVGAELREHHGRLLAGLTQQERHALRVGLGALVRELDARTAGTAERPGPLRAGSPGVRRPLRPRCPPASR